MTEADTRLETVHDAVQAWQDGLIGSSRAMQLAGCDGLLELYAACVSSGVALRTTLLPDEEKAAATVGALIAERKTETESQEDGEAEMYKRKAVTLIIPDAGPLITLAIADRLELLQKFGRKILIMDVVREECLRRADVPEYPKLKVWFEKNGHNQAQIMATPFLAAFREAARESASGGDPFATRGMGDATIAWFVANISRFHSADDIGLVLTEDATFGNEVLNRDVHVLSTRAWLQALENAKLIPSAVEIIKDVQANGRIMARYMADQPAQISPGTRSDWTEHAKKSDGV